MSSKKIAVFATLALVLIAFVFGISVYRQGERSAQNEKLSQQSASLVRMHSPVIGPQGAPVTIVEFFDPACETCRAFYPIVKNLLAKYPDQVRLVIRYAPFHQGSDQVVKLLGAAKQQGKYVAVLEALLVAQPSWADHARPSIELAYKAAEEAGLDLQKALEEAQSPGIAAALQQDVEDLRALGVSQTPTFFVNGRGLPEFGAEQLAALVAQEVAKLGK